MQFRITANMHLVDDRVVKRNAAAAALARPVEVWIDHCALGHEWSAIAFVECEIVAGLQLVAEERRIPPQLADVRESIRVEQELVWIEAVPCGRFIGTVDSIAIRRSRLNVGDVAVPDLVRVLRKLNSVCLAFTASIEDADFNLRGICGEKREIDSFAVPRGALW